MWSAVSVTILSSEPDPKHTLTHRSTCCSLTGIFENTHLIWNLCSCSTADFLHSASWKRTVPALHSSVCLSVWLRDTQRSCRWIWRVSLYLCTQGSALSARGGWGGALLHLSLWVRGSRHNAAVNTADWDLWALWKFNVTLRVTCAHWGQRWARPGDGPGLPCVDTLETKRQSGGGIRSQACFVPRGMDNETSVSTSHMERWGSLSHLKRTQVTFLICLRQDRDMIWCRGAFTLNVLYPCFSYFPLCHTAHSFLSQTFFLHLDKCVPNQTWVSFNYPRPTKGYTS